MFGSKGGGDAVSLNWNHLPRVPAVAGRKTDCLHRTSDFSQTRIRERQHCPWREEFFKLIAILPRQTLGDSPAHRPPLVPTATSEVFARISRAAKRGCKYTDAGVTLYCRRMPTSMLTSFHQGSS
jgi:hypothetical protein